MVARNGTTLLALRRDLGHTERQRTCPAAGRSRSSELPPNHARNARGRPTGAPDADNREYRQYCTQQPGAQAVTPIPECSLRFSMIKPGTTEAAHSRPSGHAVIEGKGVSNQRAHPRRPGPQSHSPDIGTNHYRPGKGRQEGAPGKGPVPQGSAELFSPFETKTRGPPPRKIRPASIQEHTDIQRRSKQPRENISSSPTQQACVITCPASSHVHNCYDYHPAARLSLYFRGFLLSTGQVSSSRRRRFGAFHPVSSRQRREQHTQRPQNQSPSDS